MVTDLQQGFVHQRKTVSTLGAQAEIEFLTHNKLTELGYPHAFSTRLNGVSCLPKGDLNLAFVDDAPDDVRENRRRFLTALGLQDRPIVTAAQIHSDICLEVTAHHSWLEEERSGDTLMASEKGFLIGVKTADCLPILIVDPESRRVAAVHAGWRGTLKRVVEKTISIMTRISHRPADEFIAVLGPCACAHCYEVGYEIKDFYVKEFGTEVDCFTEENGRLTLDMQKANESQLVRLGLKPAHIFAAPYCTVHQNDLFFSFRREHQGMGAHLPVGRHLAIIGVI